MEHPQNKPAPRQWRLRDPVSKADKDAIRVFNRSVARRNHLIVELKQVDTQLQEAFETLRRRGQVEIHGPSPSTETAPPEDQGRKTENDDVPPRATP